MKKINLFTLKVALLFLAVSVLSSCIKTEKKNVEADILGIRVEGVKMAMDPDIKNSEVTLFVLEGEKINAITPYFTLSPGATINPASGIQQDFTNPVTYTVTAENGTANKDYKVAVQVISDIKEESITYSFEDIRLQEETFQVFLINDGGGSQSEWASSNLGYVLTGQAKKPEDFPVSQDPNGYEGKCAKLVTYSTGPMGAFVNAPLATGSMFLGVLDASVIATNPLESTKFGIPFTKKPVKLTGYYKYTAGKEYEEKGKKVTGKKDACDIYAVLFESTEEDPQLNGNNCLTSENIILMARLKDGAETSDWKSFELPFESVNGKSIDKQKLAEGKYMLTIVMSSSVGGALHHGAVGSTLWVDEMTLVLAQ